MIRDRDEPQDKYSGLTAVMVREIFSYNPMEGVLRWKKKISKKVMVGEPAGTLVVPKGKKPTSCRVYVYGRGYEVHRLIWLYMTGEWPKYLVDHKDGNGINNKWNNLREADRSQNTRNAAVRIDNSLGRDGVYEVPGGFKAEITLHGRMYRLGTYTTMAEALAARRAAVICLHGEFDRQGRKEDADAGMTEMEWSGEDGSVHRFMVPRSAFPGLPDR